MTKKQIIRPFIAVLFLTVVLTAFFYLHESFPKPLRAITAIFGTPTAIASGISHYLDFGIPVYDTPIAVILANLLASVIIVATFYKLRKTVTNRKERT
jgi:hypothetical protein